MLRPPSACLAACYGSAGAVVIQHLHVTGAVDYRHQSAVFRSKADVRMGLQSVCEEASLLHENISIKPAGAEKPFRFKCIYNTMKL